MVLITFSGTAPLTFMATLSLGRWARFSIPANPDEGISPVIHLNQFSETIVEVVTTAAGSMAFEANEDAGAVYIQMRLDNRSGSPLAILIPGGDTVTVPPQQSVDVGYNRTAAVNVSAS